MDFNGEDENDIDFTKTFDLTGNDNDEMLKLYLKKAGLSDNIEYLTSEQRRAFIYDIVKSNKNPGYWKPSVLPQTPTPSRAPLYQTSAQRESTITLDSINDIPPASTTFDWDTYRQKRNANSNGGQINLQVDQKANTRSTLYERQFSQKHPVSKTVIKESAASTVLPTTTLITRKGRLIEVSGPQNVRHISGNMSRGMTKNSFDLTGNFNNNTLKKYMFERGITDADVSGLDCKELIRRIVQSNYTWTPPRRQNMKDTVIPPPPSETCVAVEPATPSPPRNVNVSKGGAIIVTSPVLPIDIEPSIDNIYEEIVQPTTSSTTASIRRHRRKPLSPPPPPPVQSNIAKVTDSVMPPQQSNQEDSLPKLLKNIPVDRITPQSSLPPLKTIEQSIKTQNCSPPPPPPPPPTMPIKDSLGSKTVSPHPPMPIKDTLGSKTVPPPPPPPPTAIISHPPTPPKVSEELRLVQTTTSTKSEPKQAGGNDDRNAFLESIRGGVTLKKVTTQGRQLKNSNIQSQEVESPTTAMKQVPVKLEKPDFMSELRQATLKRVKKLENNPYASESEC